MRNREIIKNRIISAVEKTLDKVLSRLSEDEQEYIRRRYLAAIKRKLISEIKAMYGLAAEYRTIYLLEWLGFKIVEVRYSNAYDVVCRLGDATWYIEIKSSSRFETDIK